MGQTLVADTFRKEVVAIYVTYDALTFIVLLATLAVEIIFNCRKK